MTSVFSEADHKLPPLPPGSMPDSMRVLLVTTPRRRARWLQEALAADAASDVTVEEALGPGQGAARLRDAVFDAVLVMHDPDRLDALDMVEGLRGGGSEEPLIVLGERAGDEMAALCFEVGADGYVPIEQCTTRSLLWILARAIERQVLLRENRRLQHAQRNRLKQEKGEAERLLEHQRAVIRDLEALRRGCAEAGEDARRPSCGEHRAEPDGCPRAPAELPDSLVQHYRELLRAYVIMGSGNLGLEMKQLADLLASAGFTARQTMQLHVHVLEVMIQGLGCRSTRHVMTRADLLILEVMVHLAENYRGRYQRREEPPRQQLLPGFDQALQAA